MSSIFTNQPIYDRTAQDVALRTKKGFFNVSDWNRVIENIITLRDWLVENLGYSPSQEAASISSNDYVTASSVPSAGDLNRVAKAIEDLKMGRSLVAANWQTLYTSYTGGKYGTGNHMNYQELNSWESDLVIAERIFTGIVEMKLYCGDGGRTLYCGDWKRGGLI